MRKLSMMFTAVLLAYATTAAAHSHLRSSTPAEGSTLAAAPAQVVLGFSEVSQLTALTLQKDSDPKLKLGPLPQKPAQQLSVALPKLNPGGYQLVWRVVGDDGHVTSGTVHFTLAAAR